jgi:hypothetical protein
MGQLRGRSTDWGIIGPHKWSSSRGGCIAIDTTRPYKRGHKENKLEDLSK